MAHDDGEVGSAGAANDSGTAFMLSSWSTMTLEQTASACPNSLKIF